LTVTCVDSYAFKRLPEWVTKDMEQVVFNAICDWDPDDGRAALLLDIFEALEYARTSK
jgi:hypothetical protein